MEDYHKTIARLSHGYRKTIARRGGLFLRIKKRASAGTGGSRITAAQVWDYAKGKRRHGRIPYETKLVL